ncbi:GNAT family N-acetyltransferase [Kitasatospora sp. NPDC005856]|uniref:GNAT family N-acetyltransferase n=1 Tax=Kitasatospora sp. NPDC005856 TaxID=3154566 RepID=UPI0033C295E3
MELEWVDPLEEDQLPAVGELCRRCLAVDGGLPATVAPEFLGSRYTGGTVTALGLRDGTGTLVAAGSVRDRRGVATVTGQVDPAHRRQGLGAALLDRLLDVARGRAVGRIAVETEALTAEADALFRSRGLRQAFAEDVLRRSLEAALPEVPLPETVGIEEWDESNQGDFFEAYRSAFAERPGFPGWTEAQWVDWTAADDDFRPRYSLLARALDGSPAAFVTCAQGFLIQIGTVPRWRGRGLGRGLATAALARMRAAGVEDVFLDVNVNNPASAALFRSLGFSPVARRARYEEAPAEQR